MGRMTWASSFLAAAERPGRPLYFWQARTATSRSRLVGKLETTRAREFQIVGYISGQGPRGALKADTSANWKIQHDEAEAAAQRLLDFFQSPISP